MCVAWNIVAKSVTLCYTVEKYMHVPVLNNFRSELSISGINRNCYFKYKDDRSYTKNDDFVSSASVIKNASEL